MNIKMTKKQSKLAKIGQPPGTLVHIGSAREHDVQISVYDYDSESVDYFDVGDIGEVLDKAGAQGTNTWINVNGVHDMELMKQIGHSFNLDPLVLEDIVNTEQAPKSEDHQDYYFIVTKMLTYDNEHDRQEIEHFCLVIGNTFLLTFQEREGDVLEPVRRRLQRENSRIRTFPGDYLAYALIDTIVDHYLISIDKMREHIEEIEEVITTTNENTASEELHRSRRELIRLRRIIWPMREALLSMINSESPLIREETYKYLRDTIDHLNGFIEILENNRELLGSLRDIHSTNISNRMNEVMKVLTIIATLFIPLTFLAGIYGMNFQFMPELAWPWAYPVLWLIMITVGLGMFLFFKRKKWL